MMQKKEVVYIREWYPELKFRDEHRNLSIRQVTCFIMTKDKKLLLVSKDGKSWSVTAGHFEAKKDTSIFDTAIREVYEESGLDISSYTESIKTIGYYVIKDVEKEINKVIDTYLQVRTFLFLEADSNSISLKPLEDDLVKYANFFTVEESMELIRWLRDSEDWRVIQRFTL